MNKLLLRTEKPLLKTHRFPPSVNHGSSRSSEAYTNQELSRLLENTNVVYIYRDGREVMSSYHQYRRGFDAEAHCSLGEFVHQNDSGMSRVNFWANHVQSWLAVPGVMAVKYEELMNDTRSSLKRLGRMLDLEPLYKDPLLPRPFKNVLASRCARVFRMRPESTAILAVGKKDWRRALTLSDRQFFYKEAGALLEKLGYESSSSWVDGQE